MPPPTSSGSSPATTGSSWSAPPSTGLVAKPIRNDPSIELVAKRGIEHELRYLEDLREQGRRVVEIDKDGSAVAPLDALGEPVPRDAGAELRAAAEQTIAAMRDGADVVYQATFFDGTWRGHADFLLRRNHDAGEPDSALGPWHYEVADTKLARHVKASAILQICSYVEQLTAVQGQQPEYLYVVLGGRERPTDQLRVDDYMAYYRRVKAEFEAAVGLHGDTARPVAYPPVGTYPEPVEHCDVCRWAVLCKARRRADDDLSLVAGAGSRPRRALKARGIPTRRGLAGVELPMVEPLDGVGAAALARIREQARIQVESEDAHEVLWELLPLDRDANGAPVADRGLLVLPEPSPGDLFLDLEGDPFALDDGVDYLFGILEPRLLEDGRWAAAGGDPGPKFHAIWSLDEDGLVTWASEKAAFERTIDLIMDRWAADPAMHVYHYAAYERTALGRLAQRHGTREEEVDRLLRGRRAGGPVPRRPAGHPGGRRELLDQADRAAVRAPSRGRAQGRGQQHRRVRDVARDGPGRAGRRRRRRSSTGIEGYNRDDVVSNWRLRDWLEERRRDLEAREGPLARPALDDGAATKELTEREQEVAALSAILTADDPDDPVLRAQRPEAAGRWLLAQLLAWHRREDKSAWWRFYELMGKTDEELIAEREPIGGLQLVDSWQVKRSIQYRVHVPGPGPPDRRGQHHQGPGDRRLGGLRRRGRRRGPDDHDHPRRGPSGRSLPRSIVPQGIVPSKELAESLLRTGHWVAEHGLGEVDQDDPRSRAWPRSAHCSCAGRPMPDRHRQHRCGEPERRR